MPAREVARVPQATGARVEGAGRADHHPAQGRALGPGGPGRAVQGGGELGRYAAGARPGGGGQGVGGEDGAGDVGDRRPDAAGAYVEGGHVRHLAAQGVQPRAGAGPALAGRRRGRPVRPPPGGPGAARPWAWRGRSARRSGPARGHRARSAGPAWPARSSPAVPGESPPPSAARLRTGHREGRERRFRQLTGNFPASWRTYRPAPRRASLRNPPGNAAAPPPEDRERGGGTERAGRSRATCRASGRTRAAVSGRRPATGARSRRRTPRARPSRPTGRRRPPR